MPLDLDIPPMIIHKPKRRKWIARFMEAILILGIMALAISALMPLFYLIN